MPVTVKIEKNIFAEKGAKEGMKDSMLEVLIKITAQAKQLCPVDFGQLANSISYEMKHAKGGFNDGSVSGGGGTTLGGADRKGTGDLYAEDSEKLNFRNLAELEGYVGTNSDHWYPEFGTRYQIAQPFLRPAKAAVVRDATIAAIGKKFGRAAMEREYQKRKKEVLKNG